MITKVNLKQKFALRKEAALMLLLYVAYLLLMWYNESIEKKFYLYIGDTKTYEARFATRDGEMVSWKNVPDEDEMKKKAQEKEGSFCGKKFIVGSRSKM